MPNRILPPVLGHDFLQDKIAKAFSKRARHHACAIQRELRAATKLSVSKLMLKPTTAKPKTIEGVLQQVEAEAGPEGRKAFEGFLRKMVRIKEEQGDSSPRKLGDERG